MTTKDSAPHQAGPLCLIGACVLLALLFAWCVVVGVWNIDSNANGHTTALALGVRILGILLMGMGSVLMSVVTFVAVRRYRGLRLEPSDFT